MLVMVYISKLFFLFHSTSKYLETSYNETSMRCFAISISKYTKNPSDQPMVELVDDFLREKLCNDLFIYLWKFIALTEE